MEIMPKQDNDRVTLIARAAGSASRPWDASISADTSVAFVDSPAFLPHAIERAIQVEGKEVVRAIIDRTGTPVQFLQLITALPHDFLGDVLFIRAEGESFLSAVGRGGDRILYALNNNDVDFYLRTTQLIGEEVAEPAARLSTA
jgi:hypothetical protein